MTVEIVPAVLSKTFKDIEAHLAVVRPGLSGVKMAQLDIIDGVFARHKTWPYKDDTKFREIVEQEHGLPFWEEFDFQVDLMVDRPDLKVMDFVHAGAAHFVLHARSQGSVEAMGKLVDIRDDSGGFSIKAGVAILPTAQPEELEPFEAQFDFVQVMGIDKVGEQGHPFNEHAIYLLERLRQRYPELLLQVDGGVSLENAHALAKAGANRLVVGHDIFEADDPIAEIKKLQVEANR